MNNIYDWKSKIAEALNATTFGALATVGADGPWSNPVYFAFDDAYNLYFISMLDCRHMRNIASDPRVAFSAFNTQQRDGNILGIYFEATAEILTTQAEREKAYYIYYGRIYPDLKITFGERLDDSYANDPNWHYVRLTPKTISLFDYNAFADERKLVPNELWHSSLGDTA